VILPIPIDERQQLLRKDDNILALETTVSAQDLSNLFVADNCRHSANLKRTAPVLKAFMLSNQPRT